MPSELPCLFCSEFLLRIACWTRPSKLEWTTQSSQNSKGQFSILLVCRNGSAWQNKLSTLFTHLPCIQMFFFNDLIRRLSTRVTQNSSQWTAWWRGETVGRSRHSSIRDAMVHEGVMMFNSTQPSQAAPDDKREKDTSDAFTIRRMQRRLMNWNKLHEPVVLLVYEQFADILQKVYLLRFKGCSEIWCTEVYYTLIILYKNCAHHYIIINNNKLNHRGTRFAVQSNGPQPQVRLGFNFRGQICFWGACFKDAIIIGASRSLNLVGARESYSGSVEIYWLLWIVACKTNAVVI